jgi:hypothetical protein
MQTERGNSMRTERTERIERLEASGARAMTAADRPPVAYSSPGQVVTVLESMVRLVEREPQEVFADTDVRRSGWELSGLIGRRLDEASDADAAHGESGWQAWVGSTAGTMPVGRSPGLSVIVPACDDARYLARTLDGVRASAALAEASGVGVELIVVDDRSTDETAVLAASGADRVVRGPGATTAAARNAGASIARGRTLVFVGADTWVEPSVLPAIKAAAADGAAGGSVRTTHRASRRSVRPVLRYWDWCAPRHDTPRAVCQFFDREVFESVGGYRVDLRMAEDIELHHRVQRRCGPDAVRKITDAAVNPPTRWHERASAMK